MKRPLVCLCLVLSVVSLLGCDADVKALGLEPAGDAGASTPARPITEPATTPNPDEAAKPKLTKIDPASAALGSIGPTIVATGTGFVPRSAIRVDGELIETTFQSETELAATIPTAKLANVSELKITVSTSAPGGGESEALTFGIENPPPEIVALSPLSIVGGSEATTLTVIGTTFVKGSTIRFGTSDLVTTFKDSEHLDGVIPKDSLKVSSSVPVTVITPAPGGGTSTKIAFTISNPLSTIDSITPEAAFVGAPDFEIVVKGTGFVAASVIVFNGTKLPTTAGAAPGEVKATVPSASIANVGDLPVSVDNPPPGGGPSAPAVFKVTNPVPVATSVAPLTVPAGSGPTPVTITGSGFVAGSKITVDNAPGATTFTSPTQLKLQLTAVQLAKVATLTLKVVTPAPGGGTSGAVPLGVPVGVPKVTAVEGGPIPVGSPDKTITIRGSLFVAASTATANGQPIAVTYANGGQLTAVVPAAMLTAPGPLPIIVTNAGAGGGSSAEANVAVACDSTDVVAILSDLTTIQTFQNDFANAPLLSRWTSDGTCPNAPLSPVITKQPARFAIVQNGTAAPVTLSAWADCTNDGKGAAFLSFYRRATAPASDPERLTCEGFVADGAPHASPDSGGSTNCPGLTKANGGGITLAACERAVVHIQTFNHASTTFTPPPTLKIRAE